MPKDRVKYAMLGGSIVVVGTSIASYYAKRSMVHRPLLPLARSPSIFRIDVRGAAQVVGGDASTNNNHLKAASTIA